MTRWNKALIQTAILCLPLGCSRGYVDPNLEKQASGLLFQNYETVVSARSRVLSQMRQDNPNEELGPKGLGLAFAYLIGALNAIGPNTRGALERGSDTVLTGVKDFVRPEGLGVVSYRTCHIAILMSGAAQSLAREFGKLKATFIDGRTVWNWSIPPIEGYKIPTDFYAAIVTSSFFVLTNNRDDFREIANALAKGTTQAGVPGARDLTPLRAHAYWAYRAIRRGEEVDTLAEGLNGLPSLATGLELSTDYDDGKILFSILAAGDRSDSPPPSSPSFKPESIRFQGAGAGVWQAVIDLTKLTPSQKMAAVFQLMYYFGYGVFL